MFLSVRSIPLGGPRGAGEEIARDYTHRVIDLTEADLELWRVEQGRPEGELLWAVWTMSLERLRAVEAVVRGDRRAHGLFEELQALATAPATQNLLRPVVGSPATMASRVGDVADHGIAGVPARAHLAAVARLRGVGRGTVLQPVWGAQDRLCWWVTHRSVEALDAAGHPGQIQALLTTAELGGHRFSIDDRTERLLLRRLI